MAVVDTDGAKVGFDRILAFHHPVHQLYTRSTKGFGASETGPRPHPACGKAALADAGHWWPCANCGRVSCQRCAPAALLDAAQVGAPRRAMPRPRRPAARSELHQSCIS
jgi:hypothetical protein